MRLETFGISKRYAAPVLVDVAFQLAPGEVHALVGENGAGKSTLCRILSGLVTPDAGTLQLDGAPFAPRDKRAAEAAGIRMVRQELAIVPTLSVAENIFLAELPRRFGFVDRATLARKARALMDLVGLEEIAPETRAGDLGVGQQQAIEIAAALVRPCRVLILDEPTAALTVRETELLFAQIRRLKAAGTSIIYISHRLEELPVIADRVSVLRDGALVATHALAEMNPAGLRDELVRLMVGRTVAANEAPTAPMADAPEAIRVEGLAAGRAVHDVSFRARRGEILGFAGLMGSGRTEAMRAIFGVDAKRRGAVYLDGKEVRIQTPADAVAHGLAFVTEDRKSEGLLLPLSVRQNLTLGHLPSLAGPLGIVRERDEREAADRVARALGVRSAGLEQEVGTLSGGNQQKVVIGKWLLRDPRVLIFDEPTRGIDVGARREIYRLLRGLAAEGKTVLVVSSDLPELLELADRIAVMSLGHLVATFERPAFSQEAIMSAALSRHKRAGGAATTEAFA